MKLQDMDIENYDIETNTVNGNLNLSYTDVTELPDGLKVRGNLTLRHTKIPKLPVNLEVESDLDICHSDITKLQPGLKIGRDLDLRYTKTAELPPDLAIGGSLYIYKTEITKLSRGLKVGINLNIIHTKITEITSDLEVGGKMNLRETEITNYPVVYNCGDFDRAIYLNLKDKSLIHIGCFKGTREEAINAVNDEYYNPTGRKAYIAKIELCFSMWETMKQKNKGDYYETSRYEHRKL